VSAPADDVGLRFPTRVRLAQAAAYHELDGQTVVLNLDAAEYYALDDVGTDVWRALAENSDPEQAVSALLHKYDIDEATLRCDLSALLAELNDAGLVEFDATDRSA
jgi:ornithine carbamoyltransferase